ncbi:MAG: sugar kinase [Microbacterium sp.]
MSRLDVVTVGESLGLVVPERIGRLVHSKHASIGFGGAESNVAIGVARLGGRAGWVGRVGRDGFGELILRELRAEGVEAHGAVDEFQPTSLMIKERPTPGTSRVTYYRVGQAGSLLQPTDVPYGLAEETAILHVTGIPAGLGEAPLETVRSAIERAKGAGALVSFDVNHRSALWRDGRDPAPVYRSLAASADIVFAGDDEAVFLTGETDPEAQLEAIRALGPRCAVVKLGARGAIAADGDERAAQDAFPVQVVDTVGAGDAFVAGWLHETVRDASLGDRLVTAAACGAFACTAEGDWESAPSQADLARMLAGGAEPVQR